MSRLVGTNSSKGLEQAGGPAAPASSFSPVQRNAEAMNAEPLRRTVIISNPLGFHMRPMSAFVQAAQKFQSQIHVVGPEQQRVDGKSMFGLMALAAEQGTELILEVQGPDQAEALEVLADLVNKLAEEEGELPA